MTTYKFEYVWLDGTLPTNQLRSKTKILNMEHFNGDVSLLPEWWFDGSSTWQAEWHKSDRELRPVRAYPDAFRSGNAWLVMCEVYTIEWTPDPTEDRVTIRKDDPNMWYGFEQEYVLGINGRPLWFPEEWFPAPQGKYYCSVGADRAYGRDIVEEHLDACLEAGIDIFGINGEVMPGQWEYQVFAQWGKKAGDDVWISRYLMHRIAEQYGVEFILHPKPVLWDWNGTGMHCNFSNKRMREEWGEKYMKAICEMFKKYKDAHIAVYGAHNELRLTGAHETQRIDQFSYGAMDRGASIRIPMATIQNGWKGRLEDRRVAANADPYQVCAIIEKTLKKVWK